MALTKVGTDGVAGDAIKKGHIPAGEIEASEIATGAVGTSEIADNAVTPDEIEDGTQGDIMHYTASGVPARLGAGSSGQVLTSGGSGANVSWSNPVPGDTSVTEAKLNANAPTNGQILTADSSAGGGFKWADAPETYNDDQVQRNIAMLGFYRAIDHSKNEYSLTNQIIDDYNDASGIDASASTNEQRTSGYYVGMGGGNASGGTESTHGSSPVYKVHTFLSSGDFVCPGSGNVDYLIVAGGGAGGGWGGGGAGGLKTATGLAVTAQTYAVVVGAGGASQSGAVSNTVGNDGGDSSFAGITATGGGGGGSANNGRNGGSGGGAGSHGCGGSGYPFMCTSHGNGTAGQGNNGGEAYDGGGGCGGYQSGGGGGGAGAVGQNGGTSNGGTGGNGVNNAYRTGSNVMYAAGGGGAGYSNGCNPGDSVTGNTRSMPNGGASGVGGDGGSHNSAPGVNTATAGDTNTGSGGGGDPDAHGAGGSGIVVIRYLNNSTFTSEGGDLTLQSTAKTATAAPTKADLVLLIENSTGTATLNTDIKGYISRDGSAFTSAVTFEDAGSWGTNKRILAAHDVDLSGITSGTNVKYKITTHNQASGSKVTKIHATSLGWR